jgi:hypothetical protein
MGIAYSYAKVGAMMVCQPDGLSLSSAVCILSPRRFVLVIRGLYLVTRGFVSLSSRGLSAGSIMIHRSAGNLVLEQQVWGDCC